MRTPARLTDGVVAPEGDDWQTDRTAVFTGTDAFVEYDLGDTQTVRAVYLQADNNDQYLVEVSRDGRLFHPLFVARPAASPGMRERHGVRPAGRLGRFVRLRPAGGDGSFSVSELKVYRDRPTVFPPTLPEKVGNPTREAVERRLLLFALALVAFVTLARPKAYAWNLAALAPALASAAGLVTALQEAWPVDGHVVSVIRALTAIVALSAVARASVFRAKLPASRFAVTSVLAFCATVAVLAFYNLGQPQFWNAGENRPTFIHYHDMRMYYPVAKYFEELHYDGIYAASLAALEDGDGPPLDRLGGVEFRDMTTHEMVRVDEQRERIEEVKARFSPERWRAFVEDMRYFHRSMGLQGYLGSMRDHGANATPVWLLVARALFAWTGASDRVLLLGAGVDLALLLLAFAVIGRTYGARTMLVAMVVFGANDLYMFGSNWAGSTLRHDWMAYLALGICALRVERFALGGALLALAAMIRAFPAAALLGAAIPMLGVLFRMRRSLGRGPLDPELRSALEPLGRIALGAGACALVSWLGSSLALSFDAWPAWAEKVLLLSRDAHVNNVSLRQLCLWARDLGLSNLGVAVLGGLAGTVWVVLVFLAARRVRPDEGAVFGLFLVPVVFDPANYYLHLVYLIPLLGGEPESPAPAQGGAGVGRAPRAPVWSAALLMCASEYLTIDLGVSAHFRYESVALFTCLAALLAFHLAPSRGALDWSRARAARAAP